MSFLPKILPRDDTAKRADFERELIRREAEIGGRLFGPVAKGHHRQFFCLDPHSWIWYEEWKDAKGRHTVTTRYVVRPDGVLKSQNGAAYQRLSREEAKHLNKAAELYVDRVSADFRQAFAV